MNQALAFLKEQLKENASASPSPLMRWLSPKILNVEEGKVELQYIVRNEMTNPMGILHGGATAAIIDDAIGVTTFTFGEKYYYATINLSIDYLSSVKEGEIIIAETSIVKKGKQFINAVCEIWNSDKSRLVAKGYSNLFKTEIAKLAVHGPEGKS
ncbi:MAG: PaaI family thioesterase [Cytophagaceae bacterium]